MNHVGSPKKATTRTQLKFRHASRRPNDRIKAKKLRAVAERVLLVYALPPPSPASALLLLYCQAILRTRRRILTNYTPLIHIPLQRTNVSRLNYPVHKAWSQLRFRKRDLLFLFLAFGVDENATIRLSNRSRINEA